MPKGLLWFRYFQFGRFLAKTGVSHGFGFSYKKMSIALHIMFVENDHLLLCIELYISVMFVCKLAVYVIQLLYIKTQMTFCVLLASTLTD